jgi:hypothetical protein
MTEISPEINPMQIATILNQYRFEMRGYKAQELIERWLPTYSLNWIRMAILEALYQGRYKVISVEEILKIWHRRGHPTFHFTGDFERLVCKNLPDGESEAIPSPSTAKQESFREFTPVLADIGSKEQPQKVNHHPINSENPLFDNPRRVMSNVEDLISQLTVETPKLPESVHQSTNGNGSQSKETSPVNFKPAIDEFMPLLDGSELYPKLKAVARSNYAK